MVTCTYCERIDHTERNCYSLHDFSSKGANISLSGILEPKFSDEEYKIYLKLKSRRQAPSFTRSILSKAYISQTLECQSSWIIGLDASNHIFGNVSLFFSISHPKTHVITLANLSNVTSQGVCQISLSSSLNLKNAFFVPNCPLNLISLSQLTKSLNCSITFNDNSFIIQDRSIGRLITEGHEFGGLYYLNPRSSVSCLAS